MTIALQGVVTRFQSSNSASVSVLVPAGVATGEVLVAVVTEQKTSTAQVWGTPPAGWVLAKEVIEPGAVGVLTSIYTHVVTNAAGEPGSYAWPATVADWTTGLMGRFSGVDLTTVLDCDGSTARTTPTTDVTISVPPISTVTPGAMLISSAAMNGSTVQYSTPPAGLTMLNQSNGAGVSTSWAAGVAPTVGSTGDLTWTKPAGTKRKYAVLIALRPATTSVAGTGTAAGAVGWGGTVSGVTPALTITAGTADGAFSFDAAASPGTRIGTGTTTGTYRFTGVARNVNGRAGDTAGYIQWDATGVGYTLVLTFGVGTTTFSFDGQATGSFSAGLGTSTGAVGWEGSAGGVPPGATAIDQHVALGFGAPGGRNPITGGVPNQVTDRVYDLLPEMYRTADLNQDWHLYGYVDAACAPLALPTLIGNRIAAGQMTDPALTDDAWIPWLSQIVGILGYESDTIAEQRARLANISAAPALGSRGYLMDLTQEFLAGTREVTVTPAPPWGIQVRVRAGDLLLPGITTVAELTAALYATGRIPSGYVLQVITAGETWAELAVALPTWAPGEGQMWKRVDSMGLTGSGFVTGAVGWAGTEAGHAG